MKISKILRALFGGGKVEKAQYSSEEFNSIKQYVQSIANEFKIFNKSLSNQSQREIIVDNQFRLTTLINTFIFFVTIGTLIFSIYSFNSTLREQQKFQTYTYWQSFLALTVQYPDLANGMDCIDNVSIEYIAKSNSYGSTPNDTVRQKKYLKYVWFVSNALNAAEIVYTLQQDDPYWRNAIKEVLGGHRAFFNSVDFNRNNYSEDFSAIIDEAVNESLQRNPKDSCKLIQN